jgi:drug/metabolite transporter (DMT)-like permease
MLRIIRDRVVQRFCARMLLFFAPVSSTRAATPRRGALGLFLTVLWLAVGPTAIAIFTWNYGTGRLGITAASLFLNLSPVFAALLGMALGAKPTWAEQLPQSHRGAGGFGSTGTA